MAEIRLVKRSPLNEMVGALLKHLSDRSGQPPEAVATSLDISLSYLSVVESGNRAIPVYAAPGLARLGLDFSSAASLLAAVHYLDQRDSEGLAYDLNKISKRALELQDYAPHLRPVLSWLVKTISTLQRNGVVDSSFKQKPFLQEIAKILSLPPNQGQTAVPLPTGVSAIESLSPLIEDVVRGFIAQLALFPPHTNVKSVASWEVLNSSRITAVWGYVENVNVLLDEDDKFDWSFVTNENRPVATIFVPSNVQRASSTIQRRLREAVRKKVTKRKRDEATAEAIQNVVISPIPQSFQTRCDRLLLFDFFTRGPIDQNATPDEVDNRLKSGAARRFNNAWVYQLRPNVLQTREDEARVGFLATSDMGGPNGVYVVVMGREQLNLWYELFSEVGQRHD